MGTPKKPAKKKLISKSPGAKKSVDEPIDLIPKRKVIEEDDDEDFDIPLDEISGYESFEGYDEDEDDDY